MILAGIDEAGYGPVLGPLVVSLCAMRVPDGWTPDTPWTALAKAVGRSPAGLNGRLLIADSKAAFHRAKGLSVLEKTALTVARCGVGVWDALPALLGVTSDDCASDAPWDEATDWSAGDCVCANELDAALDLLGAACREAGACFLPVRSRIIHPAAFNAALGRGMNKADILWQAGSSLLADLCAACPDETVIAIFDRQGGRRYYAGLLVELFGGAWVSTTSELADTSSYQVLDGSRQVFATFQVKADANAFPVAAASMTAKYLRERVMEGLNAWFARLVPGLKPTAGYYQDGHRFLADIRHLVTEHRIDLTTLVRER